MKQRMLSAVAAVSLLVGIVAAPALASSGPPRYQFATTSYTVTVLDTYIHTFVVTMNPCDGTIAITGSTPSSSGYYTTETVTGTLANGVISFGSVYDGPYNPGFSWSGSFPVAGGALSGQFTGTVTAAPTTFSSFKNHGAYVSSMGGGSDAAHSCIGMPIKGKNDPSATTTTAPDDGMDVAINQARLAANKARLLATLEAVLAKLHNEHATDAIQKHIDKLNNGHSGLDQASDAVGGNADHPGKPSSAGQSQNHPNKDNHPGNH